MKRRDPVHTFLTVTLWVTALTVYLVDAHLMINHIIG
jgi:hypothetical protein